MEEDTVAVANDGQDNNNKSGRYVAPTAAFLKLVFYVCVCLCVSPGHNPYIICRNSRSEDNSWESHTFELSKFQVIMFILVPFLGGL